MQEYSNNRVKLEWQKLVGAWLSYCFSLSHIT